MTLANRFRLVLAAIAALALSGPRAAVADDTVLFSTAVAPNVIILADNSGSMNNVVWHPAFDPTQSYTCQYWNDNTQYSVNDNSGDGFPSGAGDTSFASGSYNIYGQYGAGGCVNQSIEIFTDPQVQLQYNSTRWTGRYLNWLFSPEADPYRSQVLGTNNGTYSSCVGGGSYDLYRRSRITAAKQILRQVICEVNASGAVRFGLAQFRTGSDPNGGWVVVPANDYLDSSGNPNVYTLNGVTQSHGDHLDDAIENLTGESWTPLGETLFQIYTYFMSRDTADRPSSGGITFPEYRYRTSDGAYSSSAPDSPVQAACQKNFVVIITDGEPTKDTFATDSSSTDQGFANFSTLIGDYNADGENEYPTSAPACPGGSGDLCARFLDDIAKFMQDNDFRPDLPAHNGYEQVIDVYTVGFTTSGSANDLLEKTAQVGNGLFSTSNNAQQLAAAIVDVINDIIAKSQSFTAATVPATRTSQGGQFYTSLFVPDNSEGFWEGHLKSWQITAAGEILDANDNCALLDPGAPATCVSGPFSPTAVPYWDAGEELDARSQASRNLFTSTLSGSPGISDPTRFDSTNLTAAHLNLTAADIPTYDYTPYTPPTTADELRTVIVDNLRGCDLGSTGGSCTERSWKLGDIFHSDPVVVPGPASYVRDPDYQEFARQYHERDRVIVAGSNDGFLRLFNAGSWQTTTTPEGYDEGTGAEIVGFMPYAVRQIAKEIPRDDGGRTFYGVDGSAAVADAWFYSSASANGPRDGTGWQSWHTVAVGGLRQGGNAYYALDLTNPAATSCAPPASGNGYPCYLWEFPREDATGGIVPYMGQTWSQPVIVKVKVNPSINTPTATTPGYDRWVAVFGLGYAPESDPNDDASYDPTATEGRGIVILDLKSGRVLAEKKFDPSATTSTTDPSAFVYSSSNPEQAMHYAMPATPGVFDLDFDGYADVIYMPDLGGNLWKWVIRGIGQDPVNGSGSVTQPNWPFRKAFSAPAHYEAGPPGKTYYKSFYFTPSATLRNGNLWVVVGSGERMNLRQTGISTTTGENNRLYTLLDRDPLDQASPPPTQVVTESDLIQLPPNTGCADVSLYDGYYFLAEDSEKFVTEIDIFSYTVLAASYLPTTSTNPCVTNGLAKLYAYKVYCGEGAFVEPGGSGTPSISVDIGAGMPTSPQITISSGGYTGSSTDPDPNKVIINNQDGEVVVPGSGDLDGDGVPDCPGPNCPCPNWPQDCPLPDIGGGVGQFYWREL